MDNFEYATRHALRFSYKGRLSTEDLWRLSLTDLNEVAKDLNKHIKEEAEESFIEKKSTASKQLTVKFEIVKHIIDVKLEEKQAREDAKKRKAERETILQILHKKKIDGLENASVEELEKRLAELSS